MVRLVRRKNGLYDIYRDGCLLINSIPGVDAFELYEEISKAENELLTFCDSLLHEHVENLLCETITEVL